MYVLTCFVAGRSTRPARPICSIGRRVYRPGRFARMRDTATSFALLAEQPVQRGSKDSGDTRALCPEHFGLYIAVVGVIGGESDSEAPREYQTIKNRGERLALSRTR